LRIFPASAVWSSKFWLLTKTSFTPTTIRCPSSQHPPTASLYSVSAVRTTHDCTKTCSYQLGDSKYFSNLFWMNRKMMELTFQLRPCLSSVCDSRHVINLGPCLDATTKFRAMIEQVHYQSQNPRLAARSTALCTAQFYSFLWRFWVISPRRRKTTKKQIGSNSGMSNSIWLGLFGVDFHGFTFCV